MARTSLKMLRRNRSILFGAIILGLIILCGILAPVLTPYDAQKTDVRNQLLPPSKEHVLGTDRFGRDVLTRLLFGARLSLVVGTSVVVVTGLFGGMVGLVSGYFTRLDNMIMRIADGFMAFPSLILAIAIMAAMGSRTSNVVLALTLVQWPRIARLTRASVLQVRELEYVESARSMGMSSGRILLRHILPNCLTAPMVQLTFILAYTILAESSLSFLGVGAPPEIPSWGNMLSEGTDFLRVAPWTAIYPGLAIMLTVISINLLGDGLRDELDPRLRGTR